MTLLPQETGMIYKNVDIAAKSSQWAAPHIPRSSTTKLMSVFSNTVTDDACDNTEDNIVFSLFLPKWAEIVGAEVNYFLRSYHLEGELETCVQVIGSMLKPRPKVKIRLVDDREYGREYISISLVSNRKNVSDMADCIYNCNIAIARSLPSSKLQYFVITME